MHLPTTTTTTTIFIHSEHLRQVTEDRHVHDRLLKEHLHPLPSLIDGMLEILAEGS